MKLSKLRTSVHPPPSLCLPSAARPQKPLLSSPQGRIFTGSTAPSPMEPATVSHRLMNLPIMVTVNTVFPLGHEQRGSLCLCSLPPLSLPPLLTAPLLTASYG